MSCPFFEPLDALDDPGARSAMLPLGGLWSGICRAVPGEDWHTDEPATRAVCNFGYARGRCARFGDGDAPDAARFAVAEDAGGLVTIRYAVERNHHPHAHGVLELRAGPAGPAAGLLELQARAYLHNYLRRSGAASSE